MSHYAKLIKGGAERGAGGAGVMAINATNDLMAV